MNSKWSTHEWCCLGFANQAWSLHPAFVLPMGQGAEFSRFRFKTSHRKGRWKFWYGLLQKEFLANFKRVCFICLITIYGKSMDIFLVLKKHVLKAKLFANLANSTEVVPLKTDRGHVAPRIVTSWPTRHFRRDFVGIKNGSDCIKPHPEISHTYPSILILM